MDGKVRMAGVLVFTSPPPWALWVLCAPPKRFCRQVVSSPSWGVFQMTGCGRSGARGTTHPLVPASPRKAPHGQWTGQQLPTLAGGFLADSVRGRGDQTERPICSGHRRKGLLSGARSRGARLSRAGGRGPSEGRAGRLEGGAQEGPRLPCTPLLPLRQDRAGSTKAKEHHQLT